ncbi:DUF4328 domain-containing protein [Nocardioides speluncae]|uniref:DUF4328 domain-containing protein n=1 Tax=Nocardioides speluncae TaxID=2670337 RepID=UPI00137A5388|nr:DUF4328 domain-containing protein [Nocardioides speluncae]
MTDRSGPISPPTWLAIGTVVTAASLTLVQVFVWLTSYEASRELVSMARSGTPVEDAPVLAYDAANLLLLPTLLVAYVFACLWLQASRANAERISPDYGHDRGKVWVWLGWWVPIVSFWFPFQVVRDVRRALLREPSKEGTRLGLWWTGWIVALLATNVAARLAPFSGVPDEGVVRAIPWVEMAAALGLLVALVPWFRIVRTTTAAQRA